MKDRITLTFHVNMEVSESELIDTLEDYLCKRLSNRNNHFNPYTHPERVMLMVANCLSLDHGRKSLFNEDIDLEAVEVATCNSSDVDHFKDAIIVAARKAWTRTMTEVRS
jgi:hypothetical protein